MAKFKNQKCIHCLGYFSELTEDHIFPQAWYPDSTPDNMEKWTAPACGACNNKLGKMESDLYLKIAPATDPSSLAASGIADAAIRKIKPELATDPRSKGRKLADLKKLASQMETVQELPRNLMKNFGPTVKQEKYGGFTISNQQLDELAYKLVRGLEHRLYNRLVEDDRIIRTVHLTQEAASFEEVRQLKAILMQDGRKEERGPGFLVEHVQDRFGNMLYHITIWGKLELWAAVAPKNPD